jgi:hypothetical protein
MQGIRKGVRYAVGTALVIGAAVVTREVFLAIEENAQEDRERIQRRVVHRRRIRNFLL